MEEKKLLFRLIYSALICVSTFAQMCVAPMDVSAHAIDVKEFPTELNPSTKVWVEELHEKSKQIQVTAVKPRGFSRGALDANLYVFVTTKMTDQNLKSLIKEAKKYNGTVLLRGLKDESMTKTIEYFQGLLKEDLEGIAIDPTLFREYGIERAPTFVLEATGGKPTGGKPTCGREEGKLFDKVEGNVSLRYALEKMADQGDLKESAAKLLGQGS